MEWMVCLVELSDLALNLLQTMSLSIVSYSVSLVNTRLSVCGALLTLEQVNLMGGVRTRYLVGNYR